MTEQERAVMQQALKCLETPIHEQPLGMRTQTASALRAALAQEQPEPSGYCTLEQLVVMQRTVPSPDKIAIYTAPPQQPEPVSAADLVQRIRELRDEAAKMFIESGSPGYKLHDLYRMKLDAILVAPPQQPEPAQEPVAWMYHGIRHDGTPHDRPSLIWRPEYMDAMSASKGAQATPLYTTPPQRPRLTDEEMLGIIDAELEGGSLLDVARAVERRVRGE